MAFVKDAWIKASRDLRSSAQNFWLNSAFLAGDQWLYWSDENEGLQRIPRDGRQRVVDNRMAANHRTIMANVTQRALEFDVRPNGADDASQQSAFLAKELLYYYRDEHGWEEIRESCAVAAFKGGTMGLGLEWDEQTKDICSFPLTVVDFVVEPGAPRAKFARWWIRAQLLSPEEVQRLYPKSFGGKLPVADATNGLNPLQRELITAHRGVDRQNDLTLVLTYYERPSAVNKKGKVCVEINDTIVQKGDWPFPWDDRLNLNTGTETLVENRWYGETAYTHARSPQVLLNKVQSSLSEHVDDASAARLLLPHSAIRLMEVVDDIPGKWYPYPDGLQPPSWMSPPQLPGWFERQPDNYRASIDDNMGIHDVTRGKAPGRIESGTGVSILAELDGSPGGRVLKEIGSMFQDHARLVLKLLEDKVKDRRPAIVETEGGVLALDWRGSDIGGQYQAVVPIENILPRSSAAQAMEAQRLVEMGLITDIATFVRFSESPGRREILDVMQPAVAKARRNHARLARGEVVVPDDFDDFAILIDEGNKFRMSVIYERLPDEGKQNVDLYITACETLAAEQAAKAQGRAAAGMVGVPSADGAPPAVLPEEAPLPPEAAPATVEEPEPDPAALVEQLMGEL